MKRHVGYLVAVLLFISAPSDASCWTWILSFLTPEQQVDTLSPAIVRTQLSHDTETIRENRKLQGEEKKQAIHAYAAPKKKSLLQRSFVIANWSMATLLGVRVLEGFTANPEAILPAILMVPPTLFCADFLGQVFHKWLDSYASESNCLWGAPAREFRKHHEFPNNLNHVDMVSHLTAFGAVMAPMFVSANLVEWSPEYGASVWLFLMATFHSTEFHRRAHLKDPNALFKWLQWSRLAISHEQHMSHHNPPFNEEYTVLNGWSEPLTRRLELWRRMDLVFWKFAKRMPHNWIQDPRSIPPQIVLELQREFEKIPPDLWDYGDTFPSRVPPELKTAIQHSKTKWQRDYIAKRRAIYWEQAQRDRAAAEREWIIEQETYPWIYGTRHLSLDEGL